MRSFVPVVFTTALLAVAQAGFGAPPPNEAQYVYGTVKTIPTNTVGSLDLTDPTEMQFKYGDLTYKLPYHQIKSFHFSQVKNQSFTMVHSLVPKLPLPLHSTQQMLDVSYFEKEGTVGTVTFRLSGKNLKSAEWILTEHIRQDKEATLSAGRSKLPESWWGDKYWKTNRNRPAWPDTTAVATAEPVGTK